MEAVIIRKASVDDVSAIVQASLSARADLMAAGRPALVLFGTFSGSLKVTSDRSHERLEMT